MEGADERVNPWRNVMASSFADPPDVAAFRRCKADGFSDRYCLNYSGDNGIGCWGDDTTSQLAPMCALHPEDWRPFGRSARGKRVEIEIGGKRVICELRDTLGPKGAKAYRKSGPRVDLNPGAVLAFGYRWPLAVPARWRWE